MKDRNCRALNLQLGLHHFEHLELPGVGKLTQGARTGNHMRRVVPAMAEPYAPTVDAGAADHAR